MEAEQLKQQISVVFSGVERGQITLHEAKAIDDYSTEEECRLARMRDSEEEWQIIPETVLDRYSGGISFLDPVSFRYYLPAFMIWVIDHISDRESKTMDHVLYSLTLSDESRVRDFELTRFQLFSEPQRQAIRNFLEFVAAFEPNSWDAGTAREALDGYWAREN